MNLVYARKVIAKLFDEKNKSPTQVSLFFKVTSSKIKQSFTQKLKSKCCYFQIVEENNWKQISDVKVINKLCKEVMLEYPKAVKDYRKGKLKAIKFLISHVAKKTNDRANLASVSKTLEEFLKID